MQPNVYYRVHRHILSILSPSPSCSISSKSILILLFDLCIGSQNYLFKFNFSTKIAYTFIISYVWYMSRRFYPP
jgi:hypothetical protein